MPNALAKSIVATTEARDLPKLEKPRFEMCIPADHGGCACASAPTPSPTEDVRVPRGILLVLEVPTLTRLVFQRFINYNSALAIPILERTRSQSTCTSSNCVANRLRANLTPCIATPSVTCPCAPPFVLQDTRARERLTAVWRYVTVTDRLGSSAAFFFCRSCVKRYCLAVIPFNVVE